MTSGLDPTEEYDGRVTVRLLDDDSEAESVPCSSYTQAIRTVKESVNSVTTAKIIDRDDDVVFDSADMNIDQWVKEWKRQKRRLSVSVEEYDCPYDNVSCFADDLCVQCKMDKVQEQYL